MEDPIFRQVGLANHWHHVESASFKIEIMDNIQSKINQLQQAVKLKLDP